MNKPVKYRLRRMWIALGFALKGWVLRTWEFPEDPDLRIAIAELKASQTRFLKAYTETRNVVEKIDLMEVDEIFAEAIARKIN